MRTAALVLALSSLALADTIHLANGGKLEGVVLKETDTQVVIRLKYATVTLAKSDIDSIEKSKPEETKAGAGRMARWDKCIEALAARTWGGDLRQVAALVIDKGVFKNVPYMSYRAGDYEFNIYGDPDNPAAIEIGVYKELVKSAAVKKECVAIMMSLLKEASDQALLNKLNRSVDKQVREGITFEITPETAEDAYEGWWISVYDAAAVEKERATAEELAELAATREELEKEAEAKKKADAEAKKKADEEKKKLAKEREKNPNAKAAPAQDDDLVNRYRWDQRELELGRRWALNKVMTKYWRRGYFKVGGKFKPVVGGQKK